VSGAVVLRPGVDMTYGAEPTILARLRALAASLGKTITVTSGHRTLAQQSALYANRGSNPYPVAAPSANAPHIRGIAADASIDGRPIQAVATAEQLKSVGLVGLRGDAVHVQLLPGTEGFKGTVNVTGITPAPLADPVGTIGDAARDAAQAPFRWAVGQLSDTLSAKGPELLLYVALILGGGILALYGIARATGLDKKAAAAAGVTPAGRAARTAGAAL
jgi:hypothetical protein